MMYLIVGRTASGKTTFAKALEQKGLKTVVSYTTSPPKNENDNSHIFITPKEASEMKNKVLFTMHNGYQYFYTEEQLDDVDFIIVDPQGVKDITKLHPEKSYGIIQIKSDPMARKEKFLARLNHSNDVEEQFYRREQSEAIQFDAFEQWLTDFHDYRKRHDYKEYEIPNKTVILFHSWFNDYSLDNLNHAIESSINTMRLVHNLANLVKVSGEIGVLKHEYGRVAMAYQPDEEHPNGRDELLTYEAFAASIIDYPEYIGDLTRQVFASPNVREIKIKK